MQLVNQVCTQFSTMESVEVTRKEIFQIKITTAFTIRTTAQGTATNRATRAALAAKPETTTRLPKEIAWSQRTTAAKILKKLVGACNFWKNVCHPETNRQVKQSTPTTTQDKLRLKALVIVRATIRRITTSSLLMFRNPQELRIKDPSWMLRRSASSLMRVARTKTIAKFSSLTKILDRTITATKETRLKM